MIRIYMMIAISALIAGISYAAYFYYTDTQERIQFLTENAERLDNVVASQQATIVQMQETAARQKILTDELQSGAEDAESTLADLRRLLNSHNLGNLALEKPGLLENRINTATSETFRNLECLTGNCQE